MASQKQRARLWLSVAPPGLPSACVWRVMETKEMCQCRPESPETTPPLPSRIQWNEQRFPSPLSSPLSPHPAEINPSLTEGFLLKYINLISLSCQYSNWDLMYLPLLLSPSLPLPFYWHHVGLASISTVPFPAHVRWAECCQWDLSFNHWCSGSLAQCHRFTLHPGAFPEVNFPA